MSSAKLLLLPQNLNPCFAELDKCESGTSRHFNERKQLVPNEVFNKIQTPGSEKTRVFLSQENEKIKVVIGEAAGKGLISCESLSFPPCIWEVNGSATRSHSVFICVLERIKGEWGRHGIYHFGGWVKVPAARKCGTPLRVFCICLPLTPTLFLSWSKRNEHHSSLEAYGDATDIVLEKKNVGMEIIL